MNHVLRQWLVAGVLTSTSAAVLSAQATAPKPAAPARPAAPATSSAAPARFVVLGCVVREGSTGAAAQRFTITDKRGDKPTTYRLDGDAKELDFQLGHMVELAGTLSTGTGPGASALVLKIASVTWIASNCPK